MQQAPERRVLFHLNWHKAVLCAGVLCLGFLTIFVPWKGPRLDARGYRFIWAPVDGCSVDLARQLMPMMFVMLASGTGVYLTKGLLSRPIHAPEPAPQLSQQATPSSAVAAPTLESEPADSQGQIGTNPSTSRSNRFSTFDIVWIVSVLIALFLGGLSSLWNGFR